MATPWGKRRDEQRLATCQAWYGVQTPSAHAPVRLQKGGNVEKGVAKKQSGKTRQVLAERKICLENGKRADETLERSGQ